jgi:hypothetical protein
VDCSASAEQSKRPSWLPVTSRILESVGKGNQTSSNEIHNLIDCQKPCCAKIVVILENQN